MPWRRPQVARAGEPTRGGQNFSAGQRQPRRRREVKPQPTGLRAECSCVLDGPLPRSPGSQSKHQGCVRTLACVHVVGYLAFWRGSAPCQGPEWERVNTSGWLPARTESGEHCRAASAYLWTWMGSRDARKSAVAFKPALSAACRSFLARIRTRATAASLASMTAFDCWRPCGQVRQTGEGLMRR